MAGAAWPETSVPMNRPMAQNGSTPSTLTSNTVANCMKVSGTCATNTASAIMSSEPMATKIMAMTMRASR